MKERHVALVDDDCTIMAVCNYCGEFTSDEIHYARREVGTCCGGLLSPTRCPNCKNGLRAVTSPSNAPLGGR